MARRSHAHAFDEPAALPALRFDAPAPDPSEDASAAAEGSREGVPYAVPRAGWFRRARPALLLALLCAALTAAVWLAWTPVLQGISEGAGALAAQEGDGRAQLTATVTLAGVALLGFVAVWARASHPRRAVRLSRGRGRMAVDAVAGALREDLLALREVREAEVRVENRGRRGLLVHAWIRVHADARIDDALGRVDAAADRLVYERLGLALAEPPLVDVRYDELDLRAARGRHHDEDA